MKNLIRKQKLLGVVGKQKLVRKVFWLHFVTLHTQTGGSLVHIISYCVSYIIANTGSALPNSAKFWEGVKNTHKMIR